MSYKVFIKVGKGKNKTTMGSVPLKSKQKVENYIKKNPLIKTNTKIEVKNNQTGKIIRATENKFIKNPLTKRYRY